MRSKISFFILIVILFSFVLSFSSQSLSVTNPSKIQNPNVFVSEVASLNPGLLDPATATNLQGQGFIQLMYGGLFQYANNSINQLAPNLAKSYNVSSNGLVYTFSIRTGVRFASQPQETTSQPVNAYVLQYSMDRAIIMNDHAGSVWTIDNWIKGAKTVENTQDLNVTQAISFLNQQSIKAINDITLQITLSKPFGGFVQALMQPVADAVSPLAIINNEPSTYTTKQDNTFAMVSLASFFPKTANSTILQNLGLPSTYNIDNSGIVPQSNPTGLTAYTWLANHSAGTGPYYLIDLVQGKLAEFDKNTNWWNKANFQNGSPDKIQVSQVTNTTTRVSMLTQGNIDQGDISITDLGSYGVSYNGPNHENATLMSGVSGINTYNYPNLTTFFIAMNLNNSLPAGQIVENPAISNYNYGTHNVSRLLKYSWNDFNGNNQMASAGNPFSALLFREAFAYAFSTVAFINQTIWNFGAPLIPTLPIHGVIPQELLNASNLFSNSNFPMYNFSKAQALFNQVGWKGTILMTYDSNSILGNISANLLAQSINSMHENIILKPIGLSNITQSLNQRTGQYALFQSSYTPPYADPSVYANTFYGNGSIAKAMDYNNPYINELINTGARELSPFIRSSIYNLIETNSTGDYPLVFARQEENIHSVRSWIEFINESFSDSLNPMLYFLPLQYLGKGHNLTPGGSCTTCDPLQQLVSVNFLLVIILITCLGLILAYINKNKKLQRRRISNQKKTYIDKTTNGLLCPRCNAVIKPKDIFCEECGTKL